jgi:hypothetical protein
MGYRRFHRQVSLSVGFPLGNMGRGSIYRELWEIVEGGLWKWSISLYGRSIRRTWRHRRRLWRWAPLSMGASLGTLEEGSYAGACVWKKVLIWVSLPIGTPVVETGEGSCIYQELWELAEGGLWLWSISLYESSVRVTWRGAPLLGTL